MFEHRIHLNSFSKVRAARKRVGRGVGSGRGGTSGMGDKGQSARSGVSVKNRHAKLFRTFPKVGFTSNKEKPEAISLASILGQKGIDVSKQINLNGGKKAKKIKLIGKFDVLVPLHISVDYITKGCRECILAAGGSVKTLGDC